MAKNDAQEPVVEQQAQTQEPVVEQQADLLACNKQMLESWSSNE